MLPGLPADVQRKLALGLSPPDLINLCLTSKQQMANICESKDFWLKKIELDYPEALLITYRDNLPLINPKRTYLRKFQEVSLVIEELERQTGFDYKTIYAAYEDIKNSAGQSQDSSEVVAAEQAALVRYPILRNYWHDIIIPAFRKLFTKQKRYRQEAEQLKSYLK